MITVYADRSLLLHHEVAAGERAWSRRRLVCPRSKKPGAGSKEPNKIKVGKLTLGLRSARSRKTKMQDMNTTDIEAATRSIAGTARSMGVDVG